jgi:hypothetical protein
MPYSYITTQSVKIKGRLFQVHDRKRRETKLILCCFEPDVLLNFKAPVAET